MKRTISKTMIALGFAIVIFMSHSTSALAAVCSKAPDGIHLYDRHDRLDSYYTTNEMAHLYVHGVDMDNKPILRVCISADVYQYCLARCIYCNLEQPNGLHDHYLTTNHCVDHK